MKSLKYFGLGEEIRKMENINECSIDKKNVRMEEFKIAYEEQMKRLLQDSLENR